MNRKIYLTNNRINRLKNCNYMNKIDYIEVKKNNTVERFK